MKKFLFLAAFGLFGAALVLNSCRKPPPPDPCENVRCQDWEKCVDGRCVPLRDL